jgi:hypothetical protein
MRHPPVRLTSGGGRTGAEDGFDNLDIRYSALFRKRDRTGTMGSPKDNFVLQILVRRIYGASGFRFMRVRVLCESLSEQIGYKHLGLFHVVLVSRTKIAYILVFFYTGGQQQENCRCQCKQPTKPGGLLEEYAPSQKQQ